MQKLLERKSLWSILLRICLVALLSGCVVQSINPFYTQDLIAEMPDLYGQWMLKESAFREGRDKIWLFSKDSIIIPGDKADAASLSARFFKVDDMVFLDTTAAEPQGDMSLWWTLHISPMHTVSKVIVSENALRVIPLNASWLNDAVKNKGVTLRSVWREDVKENVFIASSAEWVDFLKKYGSDPQAFPDEDVFVFKRPQQK